VVSGLWLSRYFARIHIWTSAKLKFLNSRQAARSSSYNAPRDNHSSWESIASLCYAGPLRCRDIMATTSSMFMYSLTLQAPTAVTQAILGQFAGTKEQQIVTASGSRLTLHRPDPSQGKIVTALSHDVFGIIRAIAAFRLAGSSKGKF
jgi:hypothetical protein